MANEEEDSTYYAGATVLRGMMGFGANSRQIHTFRIERPSEDLPIVVKIVDTREKDEITSAIKTSLVRCS
jgi:PII-like signaling protein